MNFGRFSIHCRIEFLDKKVGVHEAGVADVVETNKTQCLLARGWFEYLLHFFAGMSHGDLLLFRKLLEVAETCFALLVTSQLLLLASCLSDSSNLRLDQRWCVMTIGSFGRTISTVQISSLIIFFFFGRAADFGQGSLLLSTGADMRNIGRSSGI